MGTLELCIASISVMVVTHRDCPYLGTLKNCTSRECTSSSNHWRFCNLHCQGLTGGCTWVTKTLDSLCWWAMHNKGYLSAWLRFPDTEAQLVLMKCQAFANEHAITVFNPRAYEVSGKLFMRELTGLFLLCDWESSLHSNLSCYSLMWSLSLRSYRHHLLICLDYILWKHCYYYSRWRPGVLD